MQMHKAENAAVDQDVQLLELHLRKTDLIVGVEEVEPELSLE